MGSEPDVETDATVYQPFEAAVPEMTKAAEGGVGSKAKDALPTPDNNPEVAVAWKWIAPLPPGNPCEQLGPAQEKPAPAISPLIVVALPCGSLALILMAAPARHQPFEPKTAHETLPDMDGG